MTGPIDTIREALQRREGALIITDRPDAMAALTEVEQQLAELQEWRTSIATEALEARAVAAETALAEAERLLKNNLKAWEDACHRAEAAEQRANALADALREIEDGTTPDRIGKYEFLRDWVNKVARAALDRHTHHDEAVT